MTASTSHAIAFGFAAALSLVAAAAEAHVTLEVKQATINSGYKAVFRVPHGCDGAATTRLRIQIPPGFIAVKPQPKPGWTLETVKGPYVTPVKYEGGMLTTGVTEVDFTGRLPDEYYDEFVLTGTFSNMLTAGEMFYFPVVQECETGVHRWIEIPAAGKKADDYKEPAPGLKLLPAAGN